MYRYVRKLDQELHKFKMELEADHIGITEILEKRKYTVKQGISFKYDILSNIQKNHTHCKFYRLVCRNKHYTYTLAIVVKANFFLVRWYIESLL